MATKTIKKLTQEQREQADIRRQNNKILVIFFLLIVVVAGSYGGWHIWQSRDNAKLKQDATPAAALSIIKPEKTLTVKPGSIDASGPYAGWSTYRNDSYGFSLKYPYDTVNTSAYNPLHWTVQEQVAAVYRGQPDLQAMTVSFSVPNPDNQRYAAAMSMSVSNASFQESVATVGNGLQSTANQKVTKDLTVINGHNAVKYTTLPSESIGDETYLISAGKLTYVFTSSSTHNATRIPGYLGVFEKVVNSFTVK